MKHVILGAGPAGVIAAETIRKHAPNDEILIIGDEAEPPYSRMAIPYLLVGKIDEDGTYLRRGANHFEQLRIELRRARAKAVDVDRRVVVLEGDAEEPFDRLLIATGSTPATPAIPGIHGRGVHPCWTLKDARAIAALAVPGARVIQMGAGFIGCIIMEALAARGVRLSVVEMGNRMVPRMMGPIAGSMIRDWCEGKGIHVHTGARVEAIDRPSFGEATKDAAGQAPEAAPMSVRLSTGQRLEADLVISATGVRPNIGFLENSGILCLQGVLTDERLQTNVPGVYAAGDCAEAFDKISGRTMVSAIQPNASEQARIAALNMIGRDTTLPGVTQINVLDTLGLVSASFGNWQGVDGGERVEVTDRAAGRHISLQFDGDRMIGCNAIGWQQHLGVMRGLVEGEVRLTPDWKRRLLEDPTKVAEAYLACAVHPVEAPKRR